ncbi:MAG: DUF5131 family protein [Hyphomicrobiaceae bacterium]
MSDHSHIEWTDATWNPITGCSVVSPGCTNCYAMGLAGTRLKHHPSRAGLTHEVNGRHVWTGEVRLNEQWLTQPLAWNRPRRIFVCAHGDLFHEGVPFTWIDRVFAVMALTPHHDYQVLTKRSARMRAYVCQAADEHSERAASIYREASALCVAHRLSRGIGLVPYDNVWLGVSAEDQRRADERIPDLLATPAAVRFVSAEPLLGPVDFGFVGDAPPKIGYHRFDALTGRALPWDGIIGGVSVWATNKAAACAQLDWVIAGGESGPNARPMHPEWAREIRDQCRSAGVPFFFKQWGEWAPVCALTDEQVGALYRSNRKAKNGERQEIIDELYDRTCMVETACLHADGKHCSAVAPNAFSGVSPMLAFAAGKKRAGRLLDGREWSEMPTTRLPADAAQDRREAQTT